MSRQHSWAHALGNKPLIPITVSEIWDHCQDILDDPGISKGSVFYSDYCKLFVFAFERIRYSDYLYLHFDRIRFFLVFFSDNKFSGYLYIICIFQHKICRLFLFRKDPFSYYLQVICISEGSVFSGYLQVICICISKGTVFQVINLHVICRLFVIVFRKDPYFRLKIYRLFVFAFQKNPPIR